MRRLVYGVVRGGDGPGTLDAAPGLGWIEHNGLAAIFALREVRELTPTIERLEAFAATVAALHRRTTIIPCRFGCGFDSDAGVSAFLADGREAWLRTLEVIDGCDEYSVHVLLTPQELGPDASDTPEPGLPTPHADRPGTSYLLTRQADLDRASKSRRALEDRTKALSAGLDGLYRRCCINATVPGASDLITLVFLVEREKGEPFLAATRRLADSGTERILPTGPWPPYHFVAPA